MCDSPYPPVVLWMCLEKDTSQHARKREMGNEMRLACTDLDSHALLETFFRERHDDAPPALGVLIHFLGLDDVQQRPLSFAQLAYAVEIVPLNVKDRHLLHISRVEELQRPFLSMPFFCARFNHRKDAVSLLPTVPIHFAEDLIAAANGVLHHIRMVARVGSRHYQQDYLVAARRLGLSQPREDLLY